MTENNSLKEIVLSLTNIERKIIPLISDKICLEDLENKTKISKEKLRTILMLLEKKGITKTWYDENKKIVLDKFGEKFVKTNLPEILFLKEIKENKKKKKELNLSDEEFSSAIGVLKREKLIEVKKTDDDLEFNITSEGIDYLENNKENPLKLFEKGISLEELENNNQLKELKKKFDQRKGFLKELNEKEFRFELTEFGKKVKDYLEKNKELIDLELEENLSYEMLKSGDYKNKKFRYYDISLDTDILNLGRRHPMLEANEKISEVFLEMGFSEMRGPLVESAFWNMDVLWIPQDHPARDEQDTFYLEGKAEVPKELMEKVRNMHEKGIKKTHTLEGEWSEDITRKRLLRTHSTPTSFRLLNQLGEKQKNGEDINGKYFYVANNFRNEAIDATHLAEFFQTEGFIIGDDLSLADLMGFIREFYLKFGIDKIKFKPTFNPYTEPSMEAHYYDSKLNKWYALINSGIFRPETLKPFGLENKTIIAWGVGASRVATLLTGAKSMRDITGYTCDFEFLKKRPIMGREIVRRD
jgi:phenylalanyl-tRNA synthetase alpha chain